MNPLKTYFLQSLSISLLPGLISALLYLFEKAFIHFFSKSNAGSQSQDPLSFFQASLTKDDNVFPFIAQIRTTILEIYSSYALFIFLMIIIHGLFMIFKNVKRAFRDSEKLVGAARVDSKESALDGKPIVSQKEEQQRHGKLISVLGILGQYTLIFTSLQIIGLSGALETKLTEMIHPLQILTGQENHIRFLGIEKEKNSLIIPTSSSLRILEEQRGSLNNNNDQNTEDKILKPISLSIGKILSSINLDAGCIVLSKDLKTAFVSINKYGTIHIYNITNPQSPIPLSTLKLTPQERSHVRKSLLLSNNGLTLFASTFANIEIIDISNLESPIQKASRLVCKTYTKAPGSKNYKTSMAITQDDQILFVGAQGLEIINLSDPETPIRYHSLMNSIEVNKDKRYVSGLALSSDDSTLYMTNGALYIYKVLQTKAQNELKMNCLYSSQLTSVANSIALTKNNQFIFVTGGLDNDNQQGQQQALKKIDISNPEVPVISQVFPINFGDKIPSTLLLSPLETNIFLSVPESETEFSLYNFDLMNQRFFNNSQALVTKADSVVFYKNDLAITAGGNKLQILQLFANYPNRRAYSPPQSGSKVSIESFKIKSTQGNIIALSSDGKTLFIATGDLENKNEGLLEIWKVSNSSSSAELLSAFMLNSTVKSIRISSDTKRAYIGAGDNLHFVDLSDLKSPVLIKKVALSDGDNNGVLDFDLARNGSTGYFLQQVKNSYNMKVRVVNFANLSDPKEKNFQLTSAINPYSNRILVSRKTGFLVIIQGRISIFNISDPDSLPLIVSVPTGSNEAIPVMSAILSHDDKALFVTTKDANDLFSLFIYDLSNLNSLSLMSEISLSQLPYSSKWIAFPCFLSPDSKTIYFMQSGGVLAVDISNAKSPMILGVFPLLQNNNGTLVSSLALGDQEKMFLLCGDKIEVFDLRIKQTIYLNKESFALGKKESQEVMLLKLDNETMSYEPLASDTYRYVNVFLLDLKIAQGENSVKSVRSPLPPWINFEKDSHTLTVQPISQNNLGVYTLCGGYSTKIYLEEFLVIKTIQGLEDSENLLAFLIALDYVDGKHFLTGNFGSFKEFILPVQYSKAKEQIYQILAQHYTEICSRFDVLESLGISLKDKISIETPKSDAIKVEIFLVQDEAKFLHGMYPDTQIRLTGKNAHITLEGEVKGINLVLKKLVVNLEEIESCDGKIIVNDHLNSPVTEEINGISRYFEINEKPRMNSSLTVQSQVNLENIYTDEHFTLTLSEATFVDKNTEKLTYELAMNDEKRSSLPTWLTFNHLTLKGIPPEDVFLREINLVITAKNEYKKLEVPFVLRIKISPIFALKTVISVSPYVITMIGCLIYANMIYNILCKKRYRHGRDLFVEVGKEMRKETIFFVAEEKREVEIILREIGEEIACRLNCHSVNKYQLAEYFIEGDKEKIIEMIKRVALKGNLKEKLKLYVNGSHSTRELIQQMVINEIIMCQLNLKQEEMTKEIFNNLKDRWIDVVEDEGVINQAKLEEILSNQGQDVTQKEGSRELLLKNSSRLNIGLLKAAFLAYATEKHCIDVSAIDTKIIAKYQKKKNIIFKFFKLDLKEIIFTKKQKLGYGINYEVKNEAICLFGIPDERFAGKTLVVQIINRKQRILKEIWIHGVGSEDINNLNHQEFDQENDKMNSSYNVL